VFDAAYSVSYFTTWSSEEQGEVWTKFKLADHQQSSPPHTLQGVAASGYKRHVLPGLDPEPCTEQLAEPGPWHERLPHFKLAFTPSAGDELQAEFFVGREDAQAAMVAIETLGPKISSLCLVSEIRTIRGDDCWMSPAFQRDTVAFHFTFKKQESAVADLVTEIGSILSCFGARSHWGKVMPCHGTSPAFLESVYPRFGDFRELCKEIDPLGKFRNASTNNMFDLGPL